MDYIWFLFDFVGRINRVRFWLAALIIACWMAFLGGLAIGSAKLFGSSALNGFGFDTNDIFRVVDPGSYPSAFETIRTGNTASADYLIPLSFYAIGMPLFLWIYLATSIKRLHDRNKSAWWMIPFFVIPGLFDQFDDRLPNSYPVLALSLAAATLWLWGLVEMGFLKGTTGPNRYGADPLPRAVPPARTRDTPRWDQHRELELTPHSASSAGGADLTFASPAPGHPDANVKSKAPRAKNIQ
ncbi:DUF805 domain-containing protein [Bradyrhizobium sp.]|jgi:uncharacterized membrane protein YhaH (DUF805 family)|uniref:DUF805 domain-containing protein n=1 Tax=Bradyrhizobium sp. TaxID=376 RepID=UPI002CEA8975|nr:DUF805 domain-containing protein [Bradyrhizobium sp.]HWX61459.1 DUF805 domain-containing protein [Bradyrhizobium sp.]